MNYDLHFKDRLKQRFGLGGKKVIGEILSQVTSDNFVENSPNGNFVHRIHFGDKLMYIVKSRNHGAAVTVMTHRQFVLNQA